MGFFKGVRKGCGCIFGIIFGIIIAVGLIFWLVNGGF
jgi:hypothetical protein